MESEVVSKQKITCRKCSTVFSKSSNEHIEKIVDKNRRPSLAYFKIWYVCPTCGDESGHHIEGGY